MFLICFTVRLLWRAQQYFYKINEGLSYHKLIGSTCFTENGWPYVGISRACWAKDVGRWVDESMHDCYICCHFKKCHFGVTVQLFQVIF